jgi:hypothetical protein
MDEDRLVRSFGEGQEFVGIDAVRFLNAFKAKGVDVANSSHSIGEWMF